MTEVTQQYNGTAGASVLVFGLQAAQGGILELDRALQKPLVALVSLLSRPHVTQARTAQARRHRGRGAHKGWSPLAGESRCLRGNTTQALGVKSCSRPAPNAGLAPSTALTEILSQTKQASVCPWLSYPPRRSVGAENPHKAQSPRQGRVDWGHRLGLALSNLLSPQETRTSKARICPGWSQQWLMDLLGQALGSAPAQSGRAGGGGWHWLCLGGRGGERGP